MDLLAQERNHQKVCSANVSSPARSQASQAFHANAGKPGVGPNVQVNAPQQPFSNGFLGRSETTVAASNSGKLLLAGFNDAQGFCGPPFGFACTPENPPGVSGFSFSTDGGLTWTDGGAPDPALSPGRNVFTRGDPWMDRGGGDNQTFYYSNLAVDMFTGASLGVGGFAFEDVHTFNTANPNDSYDKDLPIWADGRNGIPDTFFAPFLGPGK